MYIYIYIYTLYSDPDCQPTNQPSTLRTSVFHFAGIRFALCAVADAFGRPRVAGPWFRSPCQCPSHPSIHSLTHSLTQRPYDSRPNVCGKYAIHPDSGWGLGSGSSKSPISIVCSASSLCWPLAWSESRHRFRYHDHHDCSSFYFFSTNLFAIGPCFFLFFFFSRLLSSALRSRPGLCLAHCIRLVCPAVSLSNLGPARSWEA